MVKALTVSLLQAMEEELKKNTEETIDYIV